MASTSPRPKGLIGDLASEDLNDACCWACAGGGDVLCCDGCRAVYHLACIGLRQLPEDDFFCPLCQCKACGQACRSWVNPTHINTQRVEVKQRQLQPCLQAHQPLPSGPGYLCPQEMRSWLQQKSDSSSNASNIAAGSRLMYGTAGAAGSSTATGTPATVEPTPDEEDSTLQHKAKRQKGHSNSSSTSVPSSSSGTVAAAVRCCCCQSACHTDCLPAELKAQHTLNPAADLQDKSSGKGTKRKQQQQQQEGQAKQQHFEPYYCSLPCQQIAMQLAQRCAQGVLQVDSLVDGTPVSWQLIQPAAAAAALAAPPAAADSAAAARPALASAASPIRSKGATANPGSTTTTAAAVGLIGTGAAAAYCAKDATALAQVLRDVLQLLSQRLGPAWEVRTFQDTLPWLVGGLRQNTPAGLLDLSHCHVAALWVGSTLAAAALVRVHGPAALEVCLAATQEQLQRKQLGRMLMACTERFALETLGVKLAWMPALGGVVKPCVGLSVLPTWDRDCGGARDCLGLDSGSSAVQLGLTAVQLEPSTQAAAATRASDGSGCSAHEEGLANGKPQNPKDLKACWALQLGYGPAPDLVDWLQLPKLALLRYSYVPFVMKRLSPETLVPMPNFRKKVHAGPVRVSKAQPEAPAAAVAAPETGGRVTGAPAAAAAAGTKAGATGKQAAAAAGNGAGPAPDAAQHAQKHAAPTAGSHVTLQLPLQQQVQPVLQQAKVTLQQQAQEQQHQKFVQLPAQPTMQQQQQARKMQYNYLSAQQLVDMTKSLNSQQPTLGGIAAGIAAYNGDRSKRKGLHIKQQQVARGAAGAARREEYGVGGVVL